MTAILSPSVAANAHVSSKSPKASPSVVKSRPLVPTRKVK